MTVKMSGAKTNFVTSGSVTNPAINVYYDQYGIWVNQLVKTNYLSNVGDSGAPVTSGNTLVGFQSGKDIVGQVSYFSNVNYVPSYFVGLTWGF